MGWFDEQIRQRKQNDDDVFADSFVNMASAVMGQKVTAALRDESAVTLSAIDEILKFYHVKSREVPENITDTNEQLEYLLRPYGIMRRSVNLEKGWYKDAIGAMLGVFKDTGKVVALIPSGISGYSYFDFETGRRRKINRKNESLFETEAIAFYKPLPLKKIGMGEFVKYIAETLSVSDFIMIALATLAATAVGMFMPYINKLLFNDVLESGEMSLLIAISVFTVCVSISTLLINAVKAMITARINTKMNINVQAASMMRIMSLPADFFKSMSSGELSSRSTYISSLCNTIVNTVLTTGLSTIFSLVYIAQIFAFAPTLVVPALVIIAVTVAFSLISSLMQMRISKKRMELDGKESGMVYSLITGVQKIKLGKARVRPLGQSLRKERQTRVRPAHVFKDKQRDRSGHKLDGRYCNVLRGDKVRRVDRRLLCVQYRIRNGFGRVYGAFRHSAYYCPDKAHTRNGQAVFRRRARNRRE